MLIRFTGSDWTGERERQIEKKISLMNINFYMYIFVDFVILEALIVDTVDVIDC